MCHVMYHVSTHSYMACYPPYIHTLGDTISLEDITLLEDILSVLSLATVTALTTTILKGYGLANLGQFAFRWPISMQLKQGPGTLKR